MCKQRDCERPQVTFKNEGNILHLNRGVDYVGGMHLSKLADPRTSLYENYTSIFLKMTIMNSN